MKSKLQSKYVIGNPKRSTDLSWNEGKSDADHEDHEELTQPDVWGDVAVAHRREGHNGEVEGLKQGQGLLGAGPLDVLNATHTGTEQHSESLHSKLIQQTKRMQRAYIGLI